jgi:hypothetical protein
MSILLRTNEETFCTSQVVELCLDLLVLDGDVDQEDFGCRCNVEPTDFGDLKRVLTV